MWSLVDMMTTATGLLVNGAVYDFDLVDDIRSSNSKYTAFAVHPSCVRPALPHLDLDVQWLHWVRQREKCFYNRQADKTVFHTRSQKTNVNSKRKKFVL